MQKIIYIHLPSKKTPSTLVFSEQDQDIIQKQSFISMCTLYNHWVFKIPAHVPQFRTLCLFHAYTMFLPPYNNYSILCPSFLP